MYLTASLRGVAVDLRHRAVLRWKLLIEPLSNDDILLRAGSRTQRDVET